MTKRIVLLATDGPSTRIVYHALSNAFGDVAVVLESAVSRWTLMSRRARTLGLPTVLGQLPFLTLAMPWLRRRSQHRIAEIMRVHRLTDAPFSTPAVRVPSVNSDAARQVLEQLAPTIVVVNGTRIIGAKTLAHVSCPVINMHAGITPLYRGVHGGYWALAEGRPDLVGTTVHLVTRGIDTGDVIARKIFGISPADNFSTYPYLHLAAGLPLLLNTVRGILAGDALQVIPTLPISSCLRSHPTLRQYVGARLSRGVR